jgi:hypothetical protein
MATKDSLKVFQIVTAGNMATTLTSTVTNINKLDNIGIQCNYSTAGAPVGVFSVQVSADYQQDYNGNVTNAGQWTTLTSANASGGEPTYFDMNQLSAPWIRLLYTPTSGSGSLNAYITAKQLG